VEADSVCADVPKSAKRECASHSIVIGPTVTSKYGTAGDLLLATLEQCQGNLSRTKAQKLDQAVYGMPINAAMR
jgi:hypothetical protein